MKRPRLLVNARTVDRLGRTTSVALLVIGGAGLIWLGRLGYQNLCLSSAQQRSQVLQRNVEQVQSELLNSQSKVVSEPHSGTQMVAELQAAIQTAAAQRGCVVSELVAAPESSVYISLYGGTSLPGWLQSSVRFTLIGATGSILDTLRALQNTDLLYEIASVDAQRTDVSSTGDATVTANVEIRLIRPSEAV